MKALNFYIGLVIILFVSSRSTNAQTPEWQWAKNIGGAGIETGRSMAVDESGNQYVIGEFYSSSLTFGATTITNTNTSTTDLFLAKFTSAGNVVWAVAIKGSGYESNGHVALDHAGNIFVIGQTGSSTFYIGDTTINNVTSSNLFTAKYDTSGELQWVILPGGSASGHTNCAGVAADDSGNVVVHGYFDRSWLAFGTDTVATSGGMDIFTVKLSATGNIQWLKQAGGSGFEYGSSVATDVAGSVYVTGRYEDSLVAGSINLTSTYRDLYIIKYKADGSIVWAKSSLGNGYPRTLHIDNNNNIYLGGYFDFNSPVSLGSVTVTGAGINIMLFKLDTSGTAIWGKAVGGTYDDQCWGITTNAQGDVYVTGYFSSSTFTFGSTTINKGMSSDPDSYVLKYNADGSEAWIITAQGGLEDQGNVIGIDNSGAVYILGTYVISPLTFGTIDLNGNVHDLYLAKLAESHGQITLSLSEYQNDGSTLVLDVSAYSSDAFDQLGDANLSFSFSNTADLTFNAGGQTAFQEDFAGSSYSGTISETGGIVTIDLNYSAPGVAVVLSDSSGAPTLLARIQFTISDSTSSSSFSWISKEMLNPSGNDTYTVSAIGLNNIPLPVTLISFDVSPETTHAKATWSTASEVDNYGFFLDRSTDGKSWQTAGFILSKAPGGTSQNILNYEYIDQDVYTPGSGTKVIYYRLRQLDLNGRSVQAGTVQTVQFNDVSIEEEIKAFPVPAADVVYIKGQAGVNYNMYFQDMNGRTITRQNFTGELRLGVDNLKAGVYICTVYSQRDSLRQSVKLVIAK